MFGDQTVSLGYDDMILEGPGAIRRSQQQKTGVILQFLDSANSAHSSMDGLPSLFISFSIIATERYLPWCHHEAWNLRNLPTFNEDLGGIPVTGVRAAHWGASCNVRTHYGAMWAFLRHFHFGWWECSEAYCICVCIYIYFYLYIHNMIHYMRYIPKQFWTNSFLIVG